MQPGIEVFIGAGSNISPHINMPAALRMLTASGTLAEGTSVEVSSHYVTQALNKPADPCFVNGVWRIRTRLSASQIKEVLHKIEADLGRKRGTDPYAPREINLDILLYGEAISAENGIPDPDICKRNFIFIPLLELCPDIIIPGKPEPLRSRVDTDRSGMVLSPITDTLKAIALEVGSA